MQQLHAGPHDLQLERIAGSWGKLNEAGAPLFQHPLQDRLISLQLLKILTHRSALRVDGITFLFPILAEKLGGGNTFLFFSIMMVLQLLFVLKIMPETKGKSLEQIERTLVLH